MHENQRTKYLTMWDCRLKLTTAGLELGCKQAADMASKPNVLPILVPNIFGLMTD